MLSYQPPDRVTYWPTEVPEPFILIEQYKNAALNAKEAGFDGNERAYTFTERTDTWFNSFPITHKFPQGQVGRFDRKLRWVGVEVLKVLIDIWGADKVGVKLNPCGGYNDASMTVENTIETYSYSVKEADALGLVYICLVRYAAKLDVEYDGKKCATQHDVLGTYGPLITHSKILLNADVSPQEADQLIAEKRIHAAVFGWVWISNSEVVRRLETGKNLNYNVISTPCMVPRAA